MRVVEIEIVTTEASGSSRSWKRVGERHQRVAGDVHGLQELRLGRLVKRLHLAFVVGKGDRVDQAVELLPSRADLLAHRGDLLLALDVAREDLGARPAACARCRAALRVRTT